MPKISPANVLILAQNSQTALELAQRIGGEAAQVWTSAADVPASAQPDVVVTDLPTQDDAIAALEQRATTAEGETKCPTAHAWLGIGPADWAEVHLPPDVSTRELQIACRLLAEIARLRAGQARATQLHHDATELANTDPLTGLPNRRAWDNQLASRLTAGRAESWLAILDLDRFKQVNDTLGMAAGDRLLRQAAERMAGAIRRDDLLARLGGDEFGLLLTGVDAAVASRVIERLADSIRQQGVDSAHLLTASIGYASSAEFDGSATEVFTAAEAALREAKRSGGDRAVRARADSAGATT